MKKTLCLLSLVLSISSMHLLAQESTPAPPEEFFQNTGEIYFTFDVAFPAELEALTRVISIDDVRGNRVYAYANLREFKAFLEFGYPYTLLPHPGSLLDHTQLRPPGTGKSTLTTWNFYPTYQEYLEYMDEFASAYPDICQVIFIGYTVTGRQLLAVKISDNVSEQEGEPEVFYTSSMHGDELTGYVTMLHLIDYLLLNYGSDPRITDLVDHTEIFINPLANPDGTYWGGNHTVAYAKRYNANYVDLNRNYPDPEDGPHPDGNAWQPETVAFMEYAEDNHFVMGANFHGGAEVFNYPWDTWAILAADDDWWQYIGHEYADTAQLYSPPGYMAGFDDGITNGYQWYTISGGRQDYMNYWHSDREVTLEISNVKTPPASQLLNFWEYNYRSLLNYIEQAGFGVQGTITDSVTGEPLQAAVFIPGHDIDHSEVASKLPSGYYSRLLYEGVYDIQYTAFGYFPKVIQGVEVFTRETTHLDVAMVPLNVGGQPSHSRRVTMVYPNPSDGRVQLLVPGAAMTGALMEVTGSDGRTCFSNHLDVSSGQRTVSLDFSSFAPGLYLVRLITPSGSFTDRIIIR